MITIIDKPEFITATVVDNVVTIHSAQTNKKIKVTAKYKCCYSDCVQITFKEPEQNENI